MAKDAGMNDRVIANPRSTPDWSLKPSSTPGFNDQNFESRPNATQPGFTPQPGEGQTNARSRVIDEVLAVARRNGQSPADNG